MKTNARIHVIYGGSIAVLCCVIGYLAFQLLQYSTMYQRNVDCCSEFAFSYGYAVGRGQDIGVMSTSFHHRLEPVTYEDGVLSVQVWPKREQWLMFVNARVIEGDVGMVDCYLWEEGPEGSQQC